VRKAGVRVRFTSRAVRMETVAPTPTERSICGGGAGGSSFCVRI
jgi:hypothetical protein